MQTFVNRIFHFREKGMTMIEVLMAMTIFAVGFLAIGTMVIWTTRNTTTSNIATLATMSAREKIEILKTLPVWEPSARVSSRKILPRSLSVNVISKKIATPPTLSK